MGTVGDPFPDQATVETGSAAEGDDPESTDLYATAVVAVARAAGH